MSLGREPSETPPGAPGEDTLSHDFAGDAERGLDALDSQPHIDEEWDRPKGVDDVYEDELAEGDAGLDELPAEPVPEPADEQETVDEDGYVDAAAAAVLPSLLPVLEHNATDAARVLGRFASTSLGQPEFDRLQTIACDRYFIISQYDESWENVAARRQRGEDVESLLVPLVWLELKGRLPEHKPAELESNTKDYVRDLVRARDLRPLLDESDPVRLRHGICVHTWRLVLNQHFLTRDWLESRMPEGPTRDRIVSRVLARAHSLIAYAEQVHPGDDDPRVLERLSAAANVSDWPLRKGKRDEGEDGERRGAKLAGETRQQISHEDEVWTQTSFGVIDVKRAGRRTQRRAERLAAGQQRVGEQRQASTGALGLLVEQIRAQVYAKRHDFGVILDCIDANGNPVAEALAAVGLAGSQDTNRNRAEALRQRYLAPHGYICGSELTTRTARLGAPHVLPPGVPIPRQLGAEHRGLLLLEQRLPSLKAIAQHKQIAWPAANSPDAEWDQIRELLGVLRQARAAIRRLYSTRTERYVFLYETGVVDRRKAVPRFLRAFEEAGQHVAEEEPDPAAVENGRVIAVPESALPLLPSALEPPPDNLDPHAADIARSMLSRANRGRWWYFPHGLERRG